MIFNGSEKNLYGRPLVALFLSLTGRQKFSYTLGGRIKPSVFCFCTSLLDEMKKKLYNIN